MKSVRLRHLWRAFMVVGVISLAGIGALLAKPDLRALALSTLQRDNAPLEPFAITPHVYYVGSSGIAVFAIETTDGLILIDSGYERTVPMVLANLRKLGLNPELVRILLNSHAHFDHAAGLAKLKAETGAKLYASPRDAEILEAGGRGDFFLGDWMTFPKVTVDHRLSDGEEVRLGQTVLTAHFTPGHTKGCTSWSFPVEVDERTVEALEICSLSTMIYTLVGNKKYPEIATDFAHTYEVLHGLKCELFLGPHGHFFDLEHKRAIQMASASINPFVDPAGCRAFIDASEADFLRKLKEQSE
jgi:metallo-beta-lactamase class B